MKDEKTQDEHKDVLQVHEDIPIPDSLGPQMMFARRFPRDLSKSIADCITAVTMDKESAKSMTFALPRGGKILSGPSVNLARVIAQKFGNIRVESRVKSYDSRYVTAEAICIDLENNYAVRVESKKVIIGRNGIYSYDMQALAGAVASSIASRNAIFSVVGQDVVSRIYNAAMAKYAGDLSTEDKLIARRNRMFTGLKNNYRSYNLTDKEIARSVGKSAMNNITDKDIIVLVGYEEAIASGESTFEEIFRPVDVTKSVPKTDEEKFDDRLLKLIQSSKTLKDLEPLRPALTTDELVSIFKEKYKEIENGLQ